MLRLIGGSRTRRNNSGTTWNGWAMRTPTNSTIGLPHWTSTLRNTLQISIGASLTSPDHWLNYSKFSAFSRSYKIFTQQKKSPKFIAKLFKTMYMRQHVTSALPLPPNHSSPPPNPHPSFRPPSRPQFRWGRLGSPDPARSVV